MNSNVVQINEKANAFEAYSAVPTHVQFHDSFFDPNHIEELMTFNFIDTSYAFGAEKPADAFLWVALIPSIFKLESHWTQDSFALFIAFGGGITIVVLALIKVIISGYQQFIQDTKLIKSLYGEYYDEDDFDDNSMAEQVP